MFCHNATDSKEDRKSVDVSMLMLPTPTMGKSSGKMCEDENCVPTIY